MAFVSMFFVMLGIFALILLGIGLIGFITIVISLILMRRRKKQGKKPRKIGLIIGIIIFLIPVVVILSIAIPAGISSFQRQLERKNYTCLTDEWRNEWVSDSKAKEDAIETLIKATEAGDAETLRKLFPQNAQGEALDKQIANFLENYPKGLFAMEEDAWNQKSASSGNEYFNAYYEIMMDGECYYITLQARHQSNENPEEVGITLFTIETEQAYVQDQDYSDSDYIYANIMFDTDYETRRIHSRPYIFTPIERTLTQAEVIATLENERSIAAFIEKYGEPNVITEYSNSNGTEIDYIFELEPENGQNRYLKINAINDKIIIDSCYICGTENEDYSLWFDDNGKIKSEE